jgi:hypothetical protein
MAADVFDILPNILQAEPWVPAINAGMTKQKLAKFVSGPNQKKHNKKGGQSIQLSPPTLLTIRIT